MPLALPPPLLLLLLLLVSPMTDGVSAGLYTRSDHVTPLVFGDLRSVVYGRQRHSWLLQLYHRYCGGCINYAPQFKQFASSVRLWSHSLHIGVLDVAEAANEEALEHYGRSGVPALLFVPAGAEWGAGKEVNLPADRRALHTRLLDLLQLRLRRLAPLAVGDSAVRNSLLLEEQRPGRLSRHVIAELLETRTIAWRPSDVSGVRVIRVGADGSSRTALGSATSLQELRQLVDPEGEAARQAAAAAAASAPALGSASETNATLLPQSPKLQDLRSGLVRALVSDVALAGPQRPRVWTATADFVRLLDEYFSPYSSQLAELLRPLAASLPSSPPTLDEWRRLLSEAKFPAQPPDAWVACRGSRPHLRGYPCGLWQIFHSLTVLRLRSGSRRPVLPVVRPWVIAAFSCRHCADNFEKKTATLDKQLDNWPQPLPAAEVLWLWRGHNMANRHLAGKESEDPLFPKLQFPSAAVCADCGNATNARMLSFLLRWYSPDNWGDYPSGNYKYSADVVARRSSDGIVARVGAALLKVGVSVLSLLLP